MDVRVVDPTELDGVGAALVAGWLASAPSATLMPALGTSALGVYAALGALREAGRLDTGRLRLVQLDEYVGVARDDRRSLIGWLERAVAAPLAVPRHRIIRLAGDARDADAECRRYDRAVAAAGGVDVAVLGLGPNGHLGFNEPPSDAAAGTRRVELTEASLESNARYWGSREDVPRQALTAGMPTILRARQTLLIVRGTSKQAILRRLVRGAVSADLPASFLRTQGGVTLLADRDAWPADVPVPAALAA
jgi:glucosamine-6-phosphate deaminase